MHRDIDTSLRDVYREKLVAAISSFFCEKIRGSACDVKAMYRVTNEITGRKQPPVLPECYHHNDPIDNNHHHHCTLSTFTPTTAAAIVRLMNKCPSKSCAQNPWPTTPLKTNINIIAPVLTNIINMSLQSATVPAEMKHALITPLLKKTGLDANDIKNFRPISNISFVSKLLERYVAVDLRRYIDENKLIDPFQSAYHPHHSTETALVRVHDDITQALDRRKGVILVLLNLTAAFDTVDHGIL